MGRLRKILGFTALALAMFMGTLDSTIINIALPDIMTYFKSSLNDTSWISTIYVLGLSVFMIPASKLADQFGRKKIMLIGLVVFGGSSALCSLSKTLIFLITMRFIQGIGGAIITPIVVPMAIEVFGEKNTQKVAGAVGAVTAVAAAGGPPIGGVLIKYINWQSIFFVNVPFALIAVVLTLFFIKESYDKTVSKKIDWLGMVLLTSALFLLTFALLKGNDYGWSSTVIIAMFIGSAMSAALFLLTESKSKAPLVELGLFREYTFTASNICYLITGFGIVAPLLIFNFFLQNALGYEALKAAYIVMAVSLTVIISMPLGSAIAAKLGARPVNFCGLIFMGGGAFLLSRLTANTSKFAMIADMIVFGFGLGFSCQSLVSSIKHLPTEKNGIGSGVVNAARQVGTCIGIAILVTILDTNVTNAKDTIKNDAIASVNNSSIVNCVKTVMTKDINDSFKKSESSDSSNEIQKNLQNKLKTDVEKSLSSAKDMPKPTGNGTLKKLYDGSSTLRDGISKEALGQKKLNSGISLLHSGIFSLYNGTVSLNSGAKELDSGVSQTLTGAQMLSLGSQRLNSLSSGLTALSNGTSALSNGLNKLFAQFSNTSSGNTTLKDKVDALNSGAHQVSSGSKSLVGGAKQVSGGTAALKAQFSSGASSSPTLSDRISTLNSGTQKYVGTSNSVMKALRGNSAVYTSVKTSLVAALSASAKDKTDIQNLTTALVLITDANSSAQVASTVGLLGSEGISANAAYITAQQQNYDNGGAALTSGTSALEAQANPGANGTATLFDQINALNSGAQAVVTGASSLADGATKVGDGTAALDEQMTTGGSGSATLYDSVSALSSGANQVKSGTDLLVSGTSQLGQFQSGFSSLIKALEKLKSGSSVINSGSQRLQDGTYNALDGASQSVNGSSQLVDASSKLNSGASDLVSGVGKAGQAAAIQNVIDRIKSDKDSQTAGAFDNTFLIAAIALTALSVFGLFTDKKVKEKQ